MADDTLLTLVRHGETSANVEGVWHGSIDTALTERGRRQARLVAAHLGASAPRATALYASPLARARHTAAAIGAVLDLEARLEDPLAEYHLGAWEGLSYATLLREHRLFQRMAEEPDFRPGGGESPREVATRIADALRRIVDAHPGERVVVVSHGGALTLGLGLLLEGVAGTWQRVMDNCAVTDLHLAPEPRVVAWNQTAHLAEGEP